MASAYSSPVIRPFSRRSRSFRSVVFSRDLTRVLTSASTSSPFIEDVSPTRGSRREGRDFLLRHGRARGTHGTGSTDEETFIPRPPLHRNVPPKGKEPASPEFKPCACEHALSREANVTKVVFDCKKTDGPADLKARQCRVHAFDVLADEVNVDVLVLAHHRETQYAGPAMDLFTRLGKMAADLRQFSLRDPFKAHFEGNPDVTADAKKEQVKLCQACPWNPTVYFRDLSVAVRESEPTKLYGDFVSQGERLLTATKPAVCTPCLTASREEMDYMATALSGLRVFVLYEGFRIVEPESP